MRRLLRIFFHALTISLTVLTLATLIAWPLSYFWGALRISHRRIAPVANGVPGSLTDSRETHDKVAITQGVVVLSRFVARPLLGQTDVPTWRIGQDSFENDILHFRPPNLWRADYQDPWLDPEFLDFGFGWSLPPSELLMHMRFPEQTGLRLTIPLWWLAIAFAALPGWRLQRWIRRALRTRRRKRAGLCPKCGYDLRATPQRCPECGAAGDLLGD